MGAARSSSTATEKDPWTRLDDKLERLSLDSFSIVFILHMYKYAYIGHTLESQSTF